MLFKNHKYKKVILPFFVSVVVNSFPDFHLKLMCGLLNVYVNGVRPEVILKMKLLCVPYRLGGQKRAKNIFSQHRLIQHSGVSLGIEECWCKFLSTCLTLKRVGGGGICPKQLWLLAATFWMASWLSNLHVISIFGV